MAPKHQEARDYIEQLIQQGEIKAGDSLPGEVELSKKLDVSRNTIRHALDLLSERYRIERTRGRGTIFHGEREEATGTRAIGFINSSLIYTIYPEMIHGLEEGLFHGGYSMILANGNYDPEKERESARRMLSQGVAGIITEPMISSRLTAESEFVQLLNRSGVPVLTTNCIVSGLKGSYITIDDYWIGREAARYLLEVGHRRIGCIYKTDPQAGYLRMQGLRDELAAQGVSPEEELYKPYTQEDEELVPGIHFTRELLELPDPPTAIFYFNDQIALQAYDFFRETGIRVPEDVSLLAVDNIADAERSSPGLSTFNHPKELLGKLAAEMMLNQLGPYPERSRYGVTLRPPLVRRGSVAPPHR